MRTKNEKLKTKNTFADRRVRSVARVGIFIFSFSFLVFSSKAQPLPDTDIFLVTLSASDSGVALGEPQRVTRPKHYNDQPSFNYDSHYMYYTSEADGGKTDIRAVYLPQTQDLEFIVTGLESEFYPQQKPDMTGLAVVKETDDGTRRVWFYGTDASDRVLTPNLKSVASFIWTSDTTLAFLDGSAGFLCRYDLLANVVDTLVRNVGASLAKVPSENALYYTQPDKDGERLYRYNVDTRKSEPLVLLPNHCSEFAVAVDGSLWCANGGVIYRWPRAAAKWELVKDFGDTLGNAERVALSRDMRWLAVVAEPKKQ